jgi:tetratricopeptide (TPR) repeat protein
MSRAVRWISVVALGFAAVARAQDPPPPVETPEAVAGKAAELVRDGKTTELAALAAKDKPDPWDVADALCGRGAFDAADAFARAAPRVAVEALPAYIAGTRTSPKAADGRKRLAEATSLLDGGHADEALAKLDDASTPVATELPVVPALRLRRVRGLALAKLTRTADAVKSLQSAADDADVAGWLTFAVRCRIDAAQTMQASGDLAATQAEWARIVTLRERLGDRAGVGRALSNVGSFASMRGDYRGAMVHLEKAAAVFEALGDKPEYRAMAGQVLGNCGITAKWLGRYAQSFVLLERARDAMRASGDGAALAWALSNLGNLHYAVGANERAAECESEALRLARQAGDEGGVATASALLGIVQCRLGRLDQARESLSRASELYRARDDAAGVCAAGYELARVARKSGDFEEATRLAVESERTAASLSDKLYVVRARLELGAVRLACGDVDGALVAYQAASAGAEELGLPGLAMESGRGVAATQLRLGQTRDAVASARRVLEESRSLTGGLAATQLTDLRKNSQEDLDEIDIGTRAAVALGDTDALCLFLEHGRAAVVLASITGAGAGRLREATVRSELRAQEATLREDEAAARQLLGEAHATGDLAAIRGRRGALEKARTAVAAVVERIQVESRLAASVLYPEPIDLEQMRAALRPGEALASFTAAGDETFALVATAATARVVKLGPTESLRAACAALDPSRPAGASVESIGALRARILDPLGLDGAVTRLLIVPDGPLTQVPFALLAPELEVTYVPSGTTYLLLTRQRDLRGREVIAFADPTTAGRGDPFGEKGGRDESGPLAPLPAAREEARAVGDRVLLGSEATEATLRALIDESASTKPPRRWRTIHFACHGIVDEASPWMSAVVLAPGGGHDGRLTALDVVELPLETDLAVLSACETARGKVVRGDGVVGLPRAFLAAGAARVMVSLWKVDDAASSALMKRFYGLWRDGKRSAASALRQAQSDVRAERRWEDPVFWAAWQLWGLPD